MTTNQLTTFDFNQNTVRVVQIDGEPWFVSADVFGALGYAKSSRTYHLNLLEGDEKGVAKIQTPGGAQQVRTLSESGVYKLVMRSDKPQARSFHNWVTRDVLPAIRKHGGYTKGQETYGEPGGMTREELLARAHLAATSVIEEKDKQIERLQIENDVMSEELNSVTVDQYRWLRHKYWPQAASN